MRTDLARCPRLNVGGGDLLGASAQAEGVGRSSVLLAGDVELQVLLAELWAEESAKHGYGHWERRSERAGEGVNEWMLSQNSLRGLRGVGGAAERRHRWDVHTAYTHTHELYKRSKPNIQDFDFVFILFLSFCNQHTVGFCTADCHI